MEFEFKIKLDFLNSCVYRNFKDPVAYLGIFHGGVQLTFQAFKWGAPLQNILDVR